MRRRRRPARSPPMPGPHRTSRIGHLPALDGLRGAAVAAVIAYHAGAGWAAGGFLGVDVFFVLSGFLITALLVAEHAETGRVDLRAFWARRARRLLPAAVVAVGAVAVYATVAAAGDEALGLRADVLGTLGYVQNWRLVAAGQSYFAKAALPSPLRHAWSLAVEEQFYLAWPLVAAAVLRFGRRHLGWVAAIGAAASAAAMAWLHVPGGDPSRVYYGTDTRAHGLLIGAALAASGVAFRAWGPRAARLVGAAGAAGMGLLVVAVVAADDTSGWLYEGGFVLVGLITAAVIAAAVAVPDATPARVLRCRPLRWAGRLSYGLYLWHWPVFVIATSSRTGLHGPALAALRITLTVAAAVVSHRLVETPVRFGRIPARPALLAGGAAALGSVLAVSVAAAGGAPAPSLERIVSSQAAPGPARPGKAAPTATLPAEPGPATTGGATTSPAGQAPPAVGAATPAPDTAVSPVRMLLVGDSVALTAGLALDAEAARHGVTVANHGMLGCGVARGGVVRDHDGQRRPPAGCADWPQRWASLIRDTGAEVLVVIAGRWEVVDRRRAQVWEHIGEAGFDAYLRAELAAAADVARAGGIPIVYATSPYFSGPERPGGGRWDQDDPARVDRYNALVADAARAAGTPVARLGEALSPGGRYARTVDGRDVRWSDGVHIAVSAGPIIAEPVFGAVHAAVGR